MRVIILTLFIVFLLGCSGDSCNELDLKAFERPEALHQCYPDQYTEKEMDECVKVRHANFNHFYEKLGITYFEILNDFENYAARLDEEILIEHGTYLLAKILYISDPDDKNMVSALNFLLVNGVDPFKPYKTEMAPISYLLEGVGVSRSTTKTKKMWGLVKKHYPTEKYELSKQVDLYIRHCRANY